MPYLPLPNFNHDSGPRRIQSGPDNEGYVVLYSGVEATGPNEGIVVAGSPLSGTIAAGAWDYDSNWRYVPGVSPSQSGSALDPTPYNASGAILDTYKGTRIATRTQVAGAQAANAIGPEANVLRPRQAPLQPHADVTQREKYMYFGGAAPDNQGYSPYNTPDANTPAEGRTGGPVTHRTYENTLLTNVFGTQGTSDRSQWRYHQPVYCKTYTETLRSQSPGLMSTPLRYIYRGNSTQYNLNYPLNNGFQQLPYDDQTGGCGIPVGCPTSNGISNTLTPGDVLIATPPCIYLRIEWFNTSETSKIGEGSSYTIQESDVGTKIYYLVTYNDNSTDQSSADCFDLVETTLNTNFFYLNSLNGLSSNYRTNGDSAFYPAYDIFGNYYVQSWWDGGPFLSVPNPYKPVISAVNKNRELLWSYDYNISDGYTQADTSKSAHCFDGVDLHCFTIKRDSTDYKTVYLQNLVVDNTTGNVKQIRGISYFVNSVTSFSTSNVLTVYQVETDKKGNFWVALNVPVRYVVGSLGTANTGVIISIKTNNDGSITTKWTYEIITQYIIDTRYSGALTDGFRLDIEQDLIYFQGRSHSPFSRPTPVVLKASTGEVIYKQPFATVNGDPTILGYRSNFIDSENNLYQLANNSTTPSSMAAGSAMWISKKDINKNIVWMNDYSSPLSGTANTASTNALLVIGEKLICLLSRVTGLLSLTSPTILVIDKETGQINRNIRITTSPTNDYGLDATLVKGLRPKEFILASSFGYYLTLNIDNIPLNTTLVTTDNYRVYTFTDYPVSGVLGYTSYSNTGLQLPPDRAWPAAGTYYTLPVASGIPESLASPTRVSGVYVSQ